MVQMNRRVFTRNATLGLASLTATAPPSGGQLVYSSKDWDLAAFNRLLKTSVRVKQVYDETQIGGGKFLNNIKNSLNGLHFGFAIAPHQIKIVAALHGPANMLNFDDYIWKTYFIGRWLKVNDPMTGKPATRNPYYLSHAGPTLHYPSKDPNREDSLYQDTSMQGLQARGVEFLSCHTAMEEQSRLLVKQYKLEKHPEEVVKDMMAHTLPGVLVVASMVAAIALLQSEGGYTYITV
jgi:intracellular sulfur oxidation DsrE/DsrF family protein